MSEIDVSKDDSVWIAELVEHLRLASSAPDPLLHLLQLLPSLDTIIQISVSRVQGAVPPTTGAEIIALLRALAPRVADFVSNEISADRIFFGLGSACALVQVSPDSFYEERQLHVVWLTSELRSYLCRKELGRRGDPLMQAVSARIAWDAPVGAGVRVQ